MHVEIRELNDKAEDELIGMLRLQDGKLVIEPDNKLMRSILEDVIYDPRTGQCYTAERTPEDFLRHLHEQYKSAYLRATKVIEEK